MALDAARFYEAARQLRIVPVMDLVPVVLGGPFVRLFDGVRSVQRYSQKPVQDNWTLVGVNFDFNKATLRPEAFPILNNAVEILLNHPDVSVDIVGHTDQVGSDKSNDKLSLQRAESVKKYLIAKGVAASRLGTVGKGKRDLLFNENDPTSRFYNRRIEFRVK